MQLPDKYADVLCDAIDTYGREAQTDMCIEECSERLLKRKINRLRERVKRNDRQRNVSAILSESRD